MGCWTMRTLVVIAGLCWLPGCVDGAWSQRTAGRLPNGEPVALSRAAAKDVAKQMSRSVWGVVPTPPKRKADLRPSMIRGSAVAVGDGTLLASCAVVGERRRVGLVRHNKYRQATVRRLAAAPGICALTAPDAPLNVPASVRAVGDVDAGETVMALSNRTAADLALSSGRVTAVHGGARPRLDTDIARLPGSSSVVFLDLDGNLIGLGPIMATGSTPMSALPVPGAVAPLLLVRSYAPPPIRLASDRGGSPPLLLRAALDRDDDPAGSLPDEVAVSRVDEPDPAPADDGVGLDAPSDRDGDVATPADRERPRGRSVASRIGSALGLAGGRGRGDDGDRDDDEDDEDDDEDDGDRGRAGRGAGVGDDDRDGDRGRGRGLGGRVGDSLGSLGRGRSSDRDRGGDDDDDDGDDGDDGGDDDDDDD